MSVSLEEMPDEEELPEPMTLQLLYNDVTYRRCEQAISVLRADLEPTRSAKPAPEP